MSEIRANLKYTNTHEWIIDNNDGTFTLGITDHAQELLGDMVFIELPSIGDKVSSKSEFCVVESVKAASGVYAPSDLEVVEVNESLEDEPELVNSSCYDDGWLVKFKSGDLGELLSSEDYQEVVDSE